MAHFLLVLAAFSAPGVRAAPAPHTTWTAYGGSADSMQYSALQEVDKTNVGRLELAWTYAVPAHTARAQPNPLIVDGILYGVGQDDGIDAIDAATGRRAWSRAVRGTPGNRGLSYWENKDRSDRRILFTSDNALQAIDARTGEPIRSFGKDGAVDLLEGVPRVERAWGNTSKTPGRVFENLILMGSAAGEEYEAPPGDIRAYDVVTGKLVWTFHTIPHPGEEGHDTWPKDAWKEVGGANVWGEISVDEPRGIAYFPTGSPTYDFYGANRKGANLFANCLLALDARTGKKLWHFQTVHHDLWDYDLTAAPKLLTVRHAGKDVDVVAQATKSGFVFVFKRDTGEPLWPIEERPVPQSDVPGEEAWPTQPFPSKPPPIARLRVTVNDINPYADEAEKPKLRERVLAARNEGVFTPPSLRGTITVPGHWGGVNWGAAAADPRTGMMYIRSLDVPTFSSLGTEIVDPTLLPSVEPDTSLSRGHILFRRNCFTCHRAGVASIASLSRERFQQALRDGVAQMPPFPHLGEEDGNALFEYLRELNERSSKTASPSASPVSPSPTSAPAAATAPTRYYGVSGDIMLTGNRLPMTAPPWAELVAVDLNVGSIRWRAPMGTVPSLAAKGIKDTGGVGLAVSRNGPVATAGGLIFVGTSTDRMVQAYDADTGKILWQKQLAGQPQGIPSVYEVAGRQYIVFYARLSPTAGSSRPRRAYYAFALPDQETRGRTTTE